MRSLLALLFLLPLIRAGAQTPEWDWVIKGENPNPDVIFAMVIDDDGNSYVAGTFFGTSTIGNTEITTVGSTDIFVAKVDPEGNYLWVKRAGGDQHDEAMAIALSSTGTVYIAGWIGATSDFGSLTATRPQNPNPDIFVASINPATGNFESVVVGGGDNGSEYAMSLVLDEHDNIYVGGSFHGVAKFGDLADLINPDETLITRDIFVLKMSPAGSFVWAARAGGNGDDVGQSVTWNSSGVVVTGSFIGSATFGMLSPDLASSGAGDLFVAGLNSATGEFNWAVRGGGASANESLDRNETGNSVCTAPGNDIYVTGGFVGTATFGTLAGSYESGPDGLVLFVARVDGATGAFEWVTAAGGTGNGYASIGMEVASSADGSVYVTGGCSNASTFGSISLNDPNGYRMFAANVGETGDFTWAVQVTLGNGAGATGWSLGEAPDQSVVVAGFFQGEHLTFGTRVITNSDPTFFTDDFFIARLANPCAPDATTRVVSYLDKWNLVSAPYLMSDYSVHSIFPTSVSSSAFSYSGGYQIRNTLTTCGGYWLKFSGAQDITLSGTTECTRECELTPGWNLIGSFSEPVDISTPQQVAALTNPPGIIVSQVFGWPLSPPAVVIEPGKGYWIKTSQSGTLHFTAGMQVPSGFFPDDPFRSLQSVKFTDALDRSHALYYESLPGVFDSELPPPPPSGVPDVRFASHRLVASVPREGESTHPIVMSDQEYPVTIQAARQDNDVRATLLIDGEEFDLSAWGKSIVITNPSSNIALKLKSTASATIGRDFSLYDAYPNPFNPSTTISFNVPERSIVSVKVYNLLGQEVRSLIDNAEVEPGRHSVRVQAGELATGVYVCRFEAVGAMESFVDVMKLMVVK